VDAGPCVGVQEVNEWRLLPTDFRDFRALQAETPHQSFLAKDEGIDIVPARRRREALGFPGVHHDDRWARSDLETGAVLQILQCRVRGTLEAFTRQSMQQLLQGMLEEEVGRDTRGGYPKETPMATVTVLNFNTLEGADEMLGRNQALHKNHLIKLHDAATRRLIVAARALAATRALPARAFAQSAPGTAIDDRWHFVIAPYFRGSGMEGDVDAKGATSGPVHVTFGDILDNLDFAFRGRFAGRMNGVGLEMHVVYLNLGADVTGPVAGQVGLGADVKALFLDGYPSYRVENNDARYAW
jgi:hypothetical protein